MGTVPRSSHQLRAIALAVVLAVGSACASTSTASRRPPPSTSVTTGPPTSPAPAPPAPCGVVAAGPLHDDHVLWIWMENHTASDVLGNADAPYTTALARQCGRAARYESVGSPSLPNYIGATS